MEPNLTCRKCGAEYEIEKIGLNESDQDELSCEVCGMELMRWTGFATFVSKLIRKGSDN